MCLTSKPARIMSDILLIIAVVFICVRRLHASNDLHVAKLELIPKIKGNIFHFEAGNLESAEKYISSDFYDCFVYSENLGINNKLDKVSRKAKPRRCYPILQNTTSKSTKTPTETTILPTFTSTQSPTTPYAASWPSNQELRVQISQAILQFGGNLSASEYQSLMDASRDLNTFMQYWNSTQISILTPIIGEAMLSQSAIHNSSTPVSSITYDLEAQQNITLSLQQYAPNMSPSDIQFVIDTLETISTIAVNSLTLDELTQMAYACGSAFVNNTMINGPIENTTASSTTVSSTQSPTTPYAASWPSNQELRVQISQAILQFGGNLSASEYQSLMDASRDLNTFMQYWNSTQISILTPIIGEAMLSQSAIHNSSTPVSSITYDLEAQQNITLSLQQYAPNMSPSDIQFVIDTLETISTIAVNSLTLDELTQMAYACGSAFVNNTMINGPIETTTASFTTVSSTQSPTTPYAASWPSNQELRVQISQAILQFGGNLSASEYQSLMDASRDLNTFMQYWNSTQISILTPIIGEAMLSQSAIHNSSTPVSSITYDLEAQQNITLSLQQYAPNMSPSDIQFVIDTLETISTIAVNSLTLDELTQMAYACGSAFVNNTMINGPIENTTASSTTVSSTQSPTTPYAASWPSNQELRVQISQAILQFGGNLSASEYQSLMDASRDLNTFMQYWNSTQISILTPIIGEAMLSQSAIHNSSTPVSSITYDLEAQQNITLSLQQYAPNMSPSDIQFVIDTLETISTIAVNSLTLDELTQMAYACGSAFVNNTMINGPIETTTASSTTVSSTQSPTTPYAASWPSNQELRVQISQAILQFGGNLSAFEYQSLMDASRDLNTFMQYWNSTQISILTPIIGEAMLSQSAIHNSSTPVSSITYDLEAQQNITLSLQQYAPNMSPSDVQFVINTLEAMSTIAVNSLTLDELTQMAQACASAFINNTMINGPIETTTASSTTVSSTQSPTTPYAASWPSNEELRVQISQAILQFGGNLSASEYQSLMDASRDLNTFMQYWNSTQISILTPIIGEAMLSQSAIHNSSTPVSSITFDLEAQQNITLSLQQYAPNMSPSDIQFVIDTLETISTIAVNSLTLDELTQMAYACGSAFVNNTMINGPIETTTVSSTTVSSTQSPTTPYAASWPSNEELRVQISQAILQFGGNLSASEYQSLMDASRDLNTFMQYWNSTQISILTPIIGEAMLSQSAIHNSSTPVSSITYDLEAQQNITLSLQQYAPNMSPTDIQFVIDTLETISTIAVNSLTLDELTQMAYACGSAFVNNTMINGPIETTTASSTTVSSTQSPTTPYAASWPSNQELRVQISQAILQFGGNLSAFEYQSLMDASRDLNTFMQYWNSTQISILTPIIGEAMLSQSAIHNSSTPVSSITYDLEAQQNITLSLQQYAPNMSPSDIQFVIDTLETISTIAVNSLTLDELTQMAYACGSAFVNNTMINGPIETTTASSTTVSSTQSPTTPYAASWPSNQELRVQISQAILQFGGNLSASEYQGLMDTSRDLNTFMQYWNYTQMSILTPLIGQAIVSQAAIHNSSTPVSSITYDLEAQQNITVSLQQYAPNMSPSDVQFVINTLEAMSTIAVNSLTLDELTQMAQACASAFINNTMINGPIETTTASSTTVSSTQSPTTPYAASWPSNQELRVQISQAILQFGGNLSAFEYQSLMDASRDLNTFMQYWNSTQISILTPIIGEAMLSQSAIHNSSTPVSSITYDLEAQQNITLSLQQYAPNMSPSDIQFVIDTLETTSTIAVNSLTLDELTQMAYACGSAFVNNTMINGPIETTTASSTTASSTQSPTTPYAASWPSNQELRVQISQAILQFGGNLSASEYQGLMDTSRDLNTFMQYWNYTQMSILTPLIGQAIVSQAAIHNSSTPVLSITYDLEAQQNITLALQQYAPNMSPSDVQFVINTLEAMSTIAVNSLTLDELTQMAQACASAFINNTMINGPIEATTVSTSSTTVSTSSSTSMPIITTSTLSPAINQQLANSISSLAPGLNQTQIQNLLNSIQVLANAYYFTPAQTIIIAPGLSLFFMYHSGSSVTINGTTAVYTDADILSIVTFFNTWVPAMTSAEIQDYITYMENVSYNSQGVTPLQALNLAPALAQIFINQASTQTAAP